MHEHPSDDEFDAAVRTRIRRLVDAVRVPAAPMAPTPHVAPPSGGRRVRLAVALVAATVAVVGVAAVVTSRVGDGDDVRSAAPADAPGAEPACEPQQAVPDGTIGSGTFPDGTTWALIVSAHLEPGSRHLEFGTYMFDGQRGPSWDQTPGSWQNVVNMGVMNWGLTMKDGSLLVAGQVPKGTARVEVATHDGGTASTCPVSLPTNPLLDYFAVLLPPGETVGSGRAVDAEGRSLLEVVVPDDRDPDAPIDPRDATSDWALSFGTTVDPALVDLPLGGVPFVP